MEPLTDRNGHRLMGAVPPGSRLSRRGAALDSAVVRLLVLLVATLFCLALRAETNQPSVILVVGAAGEAEFASNFVRQVQLWTKACERANARAICIGLDNPPSAAAAVDLEASELARRKVNQSQADSSTSTSSDYERLRRLIIAEAGETNQPLWLVFIGHGTFDAKEARFNLRGPDVTAAELRDWLRPLSRPLVFIDTTSASAPFLNQLSGTNRVIVTATRSGNEQNFVHFGLFFAEALTSPDSDLDKDGQTSVLEAFLWASAQVAEFYKTQGRLATEHALVDDNGDGLGTPADWFRGVRPVKRPEGKGAVDGARAHQLHLVLSEFEQQLPADVRARRDAIELSISKLRESKGQTSEQDYYRELEKLLLDLQAAYGGHL